MAEMPCLVVRLPTAVHEALNELARRRFTKRSEIVRQTLIALLQYERLLPHGGNEEDDDHDAA